MRWFLVATIVTGCSRPDARITAEPGADASVTDVLTGRLAGAAFVARKVFVRRQLDQTTVSFAATNRGDPCSDEQDAPTLNVHLWRSIRVGETLTEKTPTLTVLHTSVGSPQRTVRLILSSETTGRIDFDAGDDSSLHGDFVATDCRTWQHKRDDSDWSSTPPKVLPTDAVHGFIGGDPFAPALVVISGHRLVFYRKKPATPCPEADEDRIVLGVASLTLGPVGFTTRLVRVRDVGGMSTFEGGNVAIELDAISAKEVRGRAYAALDDIPHSTIVGAFTATVCPSGTLP